MPTICWMMYIMIGLINGSRAKHTVEGGVSGSATILPLLRSVSTETPPVPQTKIINNSIPNLAVLDTRQLCRSTRGYGTGANESVPVRRWVDYDATDASKGGEKVCRFSDGLVYSYTGKTGNIWDWLIFTVNILFTLLMI